MVASALNAHNVGGILFAVSETEKVISLGSLVGKLSSGTGTIAGFKEDKRNKVNQSKLCTSSGTDKEGI